MGCLITDYQNIVNNHRYDVSWVGSSLPKQKNEKTTWKCGCGNLFESSYKNVIRNVTCKKCSTKRTMEARRKQYTLVGKTFGDLLVLEETKIHRHNYHYLCLCSCGNKIEIRRGNLLWGKTSHCGCKRLANKAWNWTGGKLISGKFWKSIITNSKKRKLIFDITIAYAEDLFMKQNGVCVLSGVPLQFAPTARESNLCTASLDRIDSQKGYIEGNVQWVHKTVNNIKQDLPENELLEWCKLIINNDEQRNALQ
jgi:hypothetical protein